jgi:hypothetical protein
MQAEERQHRYDDNHEADQIDETVHRILQRYFCLPARRANRAAPIPEVAGDPLKNGY